MKLYNRNLERIENISRETRIHALAEEIINFLSDKYGINIQKLQEMYNELAIVERRPNETHFVEDNGKKVEISSGKGAASFAKHKRQDYNNEKWTFENAVYTSDTNSDHTIKHELLHYFSMKMQMNFNTNDIGYDKTGLSIKGYDRDDNAVDFSMHANGLNEGITELLANQLDGKNAPDIYAYQVCMADILISNNNKSLIKAYFSDNEKDFQDFLEEFGKRQTTISPNELVAVTDKDSFDQVNKDLFKACIEYTLSFCNSREDFNKEKTRLLPIINNIKIFDYKDGKKTEQYLLSTINEAEKKIEQDKNNPKMKFIKGFIQAYNDTEDEMQYEKRANCDLLDIKRLKDILESKTMGVLNRTLLADLEGKWIGTPGDEEFQVQYSQKQVSAMARLLKVAQLLTQSKKLNPDARDYLEEFTNIPDIESMLVEMKKDLNDKDSYMYALKQKARENRENGIIPNYPPTPAEVEATDTPPPSTIRTSSKTRNGSITGTN